MADKKVLAGGGAAIAVVAIVLIAGFSMGWFTPSTPIVLKGSTTVLPIAEAAAEDFNAANPSYDVQVAGGGSSTGVSSAADGTADIGMASRAVKSSELTAHPDLLQIPICSDGIALIVNPANTITALTTAQVKQIYDGNITNWSQLGGADATIVVVGRDSASGTREFFWDHVMDKAAFVSSMIEANSNGAVKTNVVGNPNAIGFVGLGYVDATVQALTIDGVDPSVATVQAGTYPISRALYFVTNGLPSTKAMAFIEYVMSADGRAIVDAEGFVSFTGLTGSIELKGSTTVLPIAQSAAEYFMMLHPEVSVAVSGGGSSTGVSSAAGGTADIGMASRPVKTSELTAHPTLINHSICSDGIAVIVNPSNGVSALTTAQVKQIYDGNITNWSQLGGADATIVVVGRDSASGTREFFWDHVMDKAAFVSGMIEANSNGAVQSQVAGNPNAIGYVGLGHVDSSVSAVTIDGVAPSVSTVQAGTYPVSRNLYFVTLGPWNTTSLAYQYYQFVLGDMGQAIVANEGFVAISS